MNLTRPEKKPVRYGNNLYSREDEIYNQAIDDMSAYQNQQMEGLEECIKNSDLLWRELHQNPDEDFKGIELSKEYLKDLATKIRELLSQKGGEK